MTDYTRANTDWLAACRIGVGVHWTAQTVPLTGQPLPFQEAVERFRLGAFLDAIDAAGADYVLFTAAHALQKLPCPHPVVDAIAPGRTCRRDLLGEIAQGLRDRGKSLVVYYNHSCNRADDPEWEQAVGYHAPDKTRFARNLQEIVAHMGTRYGDLIRAWWFDSSYSLDPSGPSNSVSTELGDFQFPWDDWAAAAKQGHPDRLVTFNAGIAKTHLYTNHQDYWAGELTDLTTPPTARYLPSGLQWHGWTCIDDRRWVYTDNSVPPHPALYTDDEILTFVRQCRKHQAPMCFNVLSFQDGTLSQPAIEQLGRVTTALDAQA